LNSISLHDVTEKNMVQNIPGSRTNWYARQAESNKTSIVQKLSALESWLTAGTGAAKSENPNKCRIGLR
jgi:hypothetical protein